MDDFKTVEKLLRSASEMAKVDSSLRKQKEERGELFNVFNTLGISTVEAVHSRIIAALLDPSGFHGWLFPPEGHNLPAGLPGLGPGSGRGLPG